MKDLKNRFYGLQDTAYFYTGAESPPLLKHFDAMNEYLKDKSLGDEGRKKASEIERLTKRSIAEMINADETEIAFTGNASEAINTLVQSLRLREGDNVILNDLEYASVVLPWIKLRNETGIEIKWVNARDGRIDPGDIERLIDDRTRLLAVSHASYLNGFRHNLSTLREITKRRNVPFLVDATQSLGVVPVNAAYCDMLVSSTYKWILGVHGLGIMYISKSFQDKLIPPRIGWTSVVSLFHSERFDNYLLRDGAAKFEVGFNNFSCIYVLRHAVQFLNEIGIERIERHVLDLGSTLVRELRREGWQVISPDREEERSGNISIKVDSAEHMMHLLERKKIKVWGGDGRIRISIHVFNNAEDLEVLFKALSELRSEGRL